MNERKIRRGLGRGSEEGRHFRSRLSSFRGPAGRLPQVYEVDRLRTFACLIREQRNFLRAADRKRSLRLRCIAKLLELGPTQVMKRGDLAVAAYTSNGGRIEVHGFFARAQ